MSFPVRVERYAINPDSGGAGRYRGGCGAVRVWRLMEGADATGALCMERMISPPFGLLGGKAGAAAEVKLTTADGASRRLPGKGAFGAPAGSIIEMITPGSGGFGSTGRARSGRDRPRSARRLRHGRRGANAITALADPDVGGRTPPHRRNGNVNYIPNSLAARDIASLVHMQTNLRRHQQEGPLVVARGEGCAGVRRWRSRLISNRWRGCGAPRSASARSGSPRSHTSRCASSATITSIATARTSRPSSSPRSCSRSRRCRWRASSSSARARRRTTPPSSSPGTTGTRRASRSARKIIARQMAYHGNTCAAVSLSGKPDMHAGFGLPFAPFKHTEFPHYYRRHEAGRERGGVLHAHGGGAGEDDRRRRARHHRGVLRRAGDGCGRGDHAAQGLFREDPGGAQEVRHSVRRRRGDLRVCAHRRDVGQPDLRH